MFRLALTLIASGTTMPKKAVLLPCLLPLSLQNSSCILASFASLLVCILVTLFSLLIFALYCLVCVIEMIVVFANAFCGVLATALLLFAT